nr:hypothetical protein [Tanacetum cinerariifolium]
MTLEEIREKFIPIWKQIKDFVPMVLKEEGGRVKRKGLKLEQGNAKKMNTSEDVSEEDLKEMIGSNDIEEMVNVLTSMDAANILTSGVQAVSVPPVAEVSTVSVPTGSGLAPIVSAIFTTASMVTPYSRRLREISAKDKGKEKMVESDMPKKKK